MAQLSTTMTIAAIILLSAATTQARPAPRRSLAAPVPTYAPPVISYTPTVATPFPAAPSYGDDHRFNGMPAPAASNGYNPVQPYSPPSYSPPSGGGSCNEHTSVSRLWYRSHALTCSPPLGTTRTAGPAVQYPGGDTQRRCPVTHSTGGPRYSSSGGTGSGYDCIAGGCVSSGTGGAVVYNPALFPDGGSETVVFGRR